MTILQKFGNDKDFVEKIIDACSALQSSIATQYIDNDSKYTLSMGLCTKAVRLAIYFLEIQTRCAILGSNQTMGGRPESTEKVFQMAVFLWLEHSQPDVQSNHNILQVHQITADALGSPSTSNKVRHVVRSAQVTKQRKSTHTLVVLIWYTFGWSHV